MLNLLGRAIYVLCEGRGQRDRQREIQLVLHQSNVELSLTTVAEAATNIPALHLSQKLVNCRCRFISAYCSFLKNKPENKQGFVYILK
jgi:hypothetical protein